MLISLNVIVSTLIFFTSYDSMSLMPEKPLQTRLFDIYTLLFSFANIFYERLDHDIHETFHVIFHYVIVL